MRSPNPASAPRGAAAVGHGTARRSQRRDRATPQAQRHAGRRAISRTARAFTGSYEAGFTGLKHSEEDVDATIAAARAVLKTL